MRLTFQTFTIWVLTALINAIISACCLSGGRSGYNEWIGAFLLTIIFTLVFSVPATFIFWITFMGAHKNDADYLFRLLLATGIVGALISAIVFYFSFYAEFKDYTFSLAISIEIATIISIVLHHSFIVEMYKNKTPS